MISDWIFLEDFLVDWIETIETIEKIERLRVIN